MKPTENQKPKSKHKSPFREWLDSVVFAVVAATLIRFFLFEAYTIPTPSMESSLMVGDFLFVSKMHSHAQNTVAIAIDSPKDLVYEFTFLFNLVTIANLSFTGFFQS